MRELDFNTRKKLDNVLEKVKEPQSELSLTELGLVKKFTFSEQEKTIIVYLDMGESSCKCPVTGMANSIVRGGIEKDLENELLSQFPDFLIKFA